jgi:twitching motility protein PilT
MRDVETISLAITAAEVGLLVMATLHTSSAAATVDRMVDVFPANQQEQIRVMLADSLAGVLCQQLPRRVDGQGRVVAYELMVRNTSIAGMIRERKTHQISTAIQTGRKQGMQLLDTHLRELVESGTIDAAEAIKFASDPSRLSDALAQHNRVGAGVRSS